MKYRLIYFLETKLGYLLSWLLSIIINKSKIKPKIVDKIIFIKFIEQGAIILHLKTFLTAQTKLGKENVFLCTFKSNQGFINTLNIFDKEQVFYIENSSTFSFIVSYLKQCFKIRKRKIESSIDLEFLSSASMIFSVLSGIRNRVGFIDTIHCHPRNKLVNIPLSYSDDLHVSKTSMLELNTLINIKDVDSDFLLKEYKKNIQESFKSQESLFLQLGLKKEKDDIFFIIHPNFIDPLPLRSWPVKNYGELILQLKERYKQAKIFITGLKKERLITEKFINDFHLKDTYNLCGKTSWIELFKLYSESDILICSDSGPAHFASLFDLKTVVMFGSETPKLYAPIGDNVEVIYKNHPCSPCFNVYNQRMSKCKDNICMKSITVDEVVERVEMLMKNNYFK